jgi:hypothetical protein
MKELAFGIAQFGRADPVAGAREAAPPGGE